MFVMHTIAVDADRVAPMVVMPNQSARSKEMVRETKSFPIGRNAKTGRLTSVEYAQRHPKTHVVERMPKPGRGDSK
jgi:hypothetical protein